MAMNQEVKKLWVEALRSGRYKQHLRDLRVGNGFCCLGVLCDIHRKVVKTGSWHNEGGFMRYSLNDGSGSSMGLPNAVAKWAKLVEKDETSSTAVPMWGNDYLANINDAGADFALIAAIIETEL